MTLSIIIEWHYAECRVFLIDMLNVTMLSAFVLNIIMLNIIMLRVAFLLLLC